MSAVTPASTDRAEKRRLVRELLQQTGHDRLVLTGVGTLAWYLDGARSAVRLSAERGVLAGVPRPGRDTRRTSANEGHPLGSEGAAPGLQV